MGLIFKNSKVINLKSFDPQLAGMVITNARIYTSINGGITWGSTGINTSSTYGGNSSGDRFLHCAGGSAFRSYKIGGGFVQTTTMPSTLMRIYRNGTTGTLIARNFGSALYRSTNDGLSWSVVRTLTPASSFNSGLHYGNGVWFHSYVDTVPILRTQHHLRSIDDGLTWSSVGITGLPPDSPGNFGGFTRYMNGKHWAYIPPSNAQGGNNRVYNSTDGLTWTDLGVYTGISNVGDNYGDKSGVFYRGGFYYGINSNAMVRSVDGITFNTYGLSVGSGSGSFSCAGYIPASGLWVFANSTTSPFYIQIWTSPDPTTVAWTLRYTDIINDGYPFSAFGYNQSDWQAT